MKYENKLTFHFIHMNKKKKKLFSYCVALKCDLHNGKLKLLKVNGREEEEIRRLINALQN